MKKSKGIGAMIVCAAALSLVFLAAGYIIDKSSPHYTVDYGDSQVTISVMKKEGAPIIRRRLRWSIIAGSKYRIILSSNPPIRIP